MTRRLLAVPIALLVFGLGCSDSTPAPRSATGGSSGVPGTGGVGGIGGVGGTPWVPACETSALCLACPLDEVRCSDPSDCGEGYVCLESGCNTGEGLAIQICAFAGGSFCEDDEQCPEGYVCTDLGVEGSRCVKTTPGCDSDFDCVVGFSCEDGGCVDRRVPCVFDRDCPMSHVCELIGLSGFCHRLHQDCESELECAGLAPGCVDIDGDGRTECAGSHEPNQSSPVVCVNADCLEPGAPVCELSQVGSATVCGRYGLCADDGGCVDGFACVALWNDGRKECVPTGGSCSHLTDCPPRQVCASPRSGGPPSCQAGAAL